MRFPGLPKRMLLAGGGKEGAANGLRFPGLLKRILLAGESLGAEGGGGGGRRNAF